MTQNSRYLEKKMSIDNCYSNMQIVFVDIVSYSRRRSHAQVTVINAFMRCIEEALNCTAREYVDYTQGIDVHLRKDVVVLPSGDGAAIAFPFDGAPNMHLLFAFELLRIVDKANRDMDCAIFRKQGWCNCHSVFLLRCGISEGKLILYKDLNGNFNIAGDVVNMAARVMGLADASQIFLTEEAFRLAAEMIPDIEKQFRSYRQAQIKHGLRINVYQYKGSGHEGLDVSPRAGLGLAGNEAEADEEVTPISLSSSSRQSVEKGVLDLKSSDSKVPSSLLDDLRDRMVSIPGGEFLMGNEHTGQVKIVINPVLIDKYPVTQDLYVEVMGRNPSRFIGPRLPVESVSWFDAVTFCNRLSELAGLEAAYEILGKEVILHVRKKGYRLPSEAEWEYCCRGGSSEERYGSIADIAWFNANADCGSHEVGQKRANGFGLYDMLGNVWEWCNDWYQRGYPEGRQINYIGSEFGFERVLRGGSWNDLPDCIRVSFRHRKTPLSRESTNGLRVVRTI